MTQAALEALKNTKLASAQPITAVIHRGWAQDLINELYDAQSRGDVLSGVDVSVSIAGGDLVLIIRGGVAKLVDQSLLGSGSDNYRGDWDPTGDVLPSSSVLRGYKWRLTADYKGIASGSTIEAAIDSPATDADWSFYVTTQL